MTDFSGPLRVRRLDSDTTAAIIEAAGSARFTGNVAFEAAATAEGDINVSGNIIHNQTGDNANAANVGLFVCNVTVNCQTATAGVTAKLATDATIYGIRYRLLDNHFGTAASDVNILIGTSADDDEYATVALDAGTQAFLEAGTTSTFTCCALAMHGIPSDQVIIKTTAVSGAVSSKNAFISFLYTKP